MDDLRGKVPGGWPREGSVEGLTGLVYEISLRAHVRPAMSGDSTSRRMESCEGSSVSQAAPEAYVGLYTRWVVHLPVHRDEEQPKAEEYGPDAVVVNVPGELLTKAYVPLLRGAATGRIAAIVGSTPAASAASELQAMRTARALALYVVGRLARPTTRTGFFWTMPMCSSSESSGQLLKEFVKVTGMREARKEAIDRDYQLSS